MGVLSLTSDLVLFDFVDVQLTVRLLIVVLAVEVMLLWVLWVLLMLLL